MRDSERFSKLVDDIWEMVFGTVRRPEVKFKNMMTKKDIGQYVGLDRPKRARTKGRYRADDKFTEYTNEAWVGGKAPKRGKK